MLWVLASSSPEAENCPSLHLPQLLLVRSLQVAGGPSGIHGQLCCVLRCTLRCDWEKQPESRDGGPFCVLCPTGMQGSGPQGRTTTTGAEATRVSQAFPEHLALPSVGSSHRSCSPGLWAPSQAWRDTPQQGMAMLAEQVLVGEEQDVV